MNLSEFFSRYGAEIAQRSWEHFMLVAIACGIAILIGIPLGILTVRHPKFKAIAIGTANIIQTIPGLALLGFLIPLGIGVRSVIIALVLYALLPIMQNTYVGISAIDKSILEVGEGMGMTQWQLLTQVELPLAMSTILTGVRVAIVICVGVAAIAGGFGAGGLGQFIFRGLATVDNPLILAGAVPSALMALLADLGIGWIEKKLKVVS
ncbi:ABC transporter permease [Tumidithrix helvetica PCC 7403]|uniref:ABC transporter permease n=1 Tax=Tumidithrix helvetica TaxID=3457545 RepID=UPI003C9F6B36